MATTQITISYGPEYAGAYFRLYASLLTGSRAAIPISPLMNSEKWGLNADGFVLVKDGLLDSGGRVTVQWEETAHDVGTFQAAVRLVDGWRLSKAVAYGEPAPPAMPLLHLVQADVDSSDDTVWVDVLSFVLAANTVYDLESILSALCTTSSSGIGIQFRYTDVPSGASITTITEYSTVEGAAYTMRGRATTGGTIYLAVLSAGFSAEMPMGIRSIIETAGSGGTLKLQLKTETTGNLVRVQAGSGAVLRTDPTITRVTGSDITNDDDTAWVDIFSLPVLANSTTSFEFLLHYAAALATAGIALRITDIPAGAETQLLTRGITTFTPSWLDAYRADNTAITQTLTPNNTENHPVRGTLAVRTAGTAGTIKLQFRTSLDTVQITVRIGSSVLERSDAVLTAADVNVSSATVGAELFSWVLDADKHYVMTNNIGVITFSDATGYKFAMQDLTAVASAMMGMWMPRGPTTFNNQVKRVDTTFGVNTGATAGLGPYTSIIAITTGAGGTMTMDIYSENTNQVTAKKNSFTILEEVELA